MYRPTRTLQSLILKPSHEPEASPPSLARSRERLLGLRPSTRVIAAVEREEDESAARIGRGSPEGASESPRRSLAVGRKIDARRRGGAEVVGHLRGSGVPPSGKSAEGGGTSTVATAPCPFPSARPT